MSLCYPDSNNDKATCVLENSKLADQAIQQAKSDLKKDGFIQIGQVTFDNQSGNRDLGAYIYRFDKEEQTVTTLVRLTSIGPISVSTSAEYKKCQPSDRASAKLVS